MNCLDTLFSLELIQKTRKKQFIIDVNYCVNENFEIKVKICLIFKIICKTSRPSALSMTIMKINISIFGISLKKFYDSMTHLKTIMFYNKVDTKARNQHFGQRK